MMREVLLWFFRSRETGKIVVAQSPNLVLWVVIAAGILLWAWPSPDASRVALEFIFKLALCVWAADELVRGVNPWRRCLGAVVLTYEVSTLL